MISKILKALNDNKVDYYIINEIKEQVFELYLIKKQTDMSRKKDITIYNVTVFRKNADNTLGDSKFTIYPSMDEEELNEIIKDAYYAAGFVKNKFYELPKGFKAEKKLSSSSISKESLEECALKVKDILYKYDNKKNGWINSSEIFVNKIEKRIITSQGADVSYDRYYINGEFVAQYVDKQDVEIFDMFSYEDINAEELSKKANDAIINAGYRDKSTEAPQTGQYNIILTETSVSEFFKYYIANAQTSMIYKRYSNFKIGDSVQGENIKGDKVNIDLKSSVPYGNEGLELKERPLVKDGVLKTIFGPFNFAYYLGIEPVGEYDGAVISGGSKTSNEMFKDGDLKIIRFSDFQMDEVSGDCFGEIRLALLKKGDKIIPLTGGSVSVNIKDVQNNMYFSKETMEDRGMIIPECIKLMSVNVAGK